MWLQNWMGINWCTLRSHVIFQGEVYGKPPGLWLWTTLELGQIRVSARLHQKTNWIRVRCTEATSSGRSRYVDLYVLECGCFAQRPKRTVLIPLSWRTVLRKKEKEPNQAEMGASWQSYHVIWSRTNEARCEDTLWVRFTLAGTVWTWLKCCHGVKKLVSRSSRFTYEWQVFMGFSISQVEYLKYSC